MPYEIRTENDVFGVYEDGEYLGILSCPYEQTAEEFVEEMQEAGYVILQKSDIANINEFADATELMQWEVFAIDPNDDEEDEEEDEDEAAP